MFNVSLDYFRHQFWKLDFRIVHLISINYMLFIKNSAFSSFYVSVKFIDSIIAH